ncbi:MAG: carboxypeptidase-like regulatory domain-containing protein [bacterium]
MRLIIVLFAAGTCLANPVVETLLSEFQVAPDSLERIELHGWNYWTGNLAGWQVVTPAGVATINAGVEITGPNDWVVLDRNNTTGTFSLPDSAGFIALVRPWGDTLEKVTWPGDAGPNTSEAWAPPEGMSCAMDPWSSGWPDPVDCRDWYVDRTPTFGAPNDDDSARIHGEVRRAGGQPVMYATVRISGPEGYETGWSDRNGYFSLHPGFGTFELTVHREGFLPGAWPESIAVEVNQVVTGISITLDPVGIAEPVAPEPVFRWSRGRLEFELARDAEVRLSVLDPAGRELLRRHAFLRAGHHRLSLPGLRPGVQFVRLDCDGSVSTGKLVVPRAGR